MNSSFSSPEARGAVYAGRGIRGARAAGAEQVILIFFAEKKENTVPGTKVCLYVSKWKKSCIKKLLST
jgi:hypothetical protein